LLGIKKFYTIEEIGAEPNSNQNLGASTHFPKCIPKTDQPHYKKQLNSITPERKVVATLKIDGQSATFFYDPFKKDAGMCSRNFRLGESNPNNEFLFINRTQDILNKLTKLGRPIAVQGEVYGLKINSNRLKLNTVKFAVFDVYEWDPTAPGYSGHYLPHDQVIKICEELDLPVVPLLVPETRVDQQDWIKLADSVTWDKVSPVKGLLGEGLVLKTCDGLLPYVSCKVISKPYCVKHDL